MSTKLRTHAKAPHTIGAKRPPYPDDVYMSNDGAIEDDDALYNTRLPSSVRRYHTAPPGPTKTVVRVTKHQAPPPLTIRASRPTTQPPQKRQPTKHAPKRLHWLFYVGSSMVVGISLWAVGSAAISFGQTVYDNITYGIPRTYQIDANVGHQGISHFIAQNLNGDIVIIEENPSNLAQSHLYQGPVFSGAGVDDYVATISFKDVTGNGKLDLIIAVNNQRYVLINTGNAFRPITSSDHVNQQEVN